MKRTPINVEQDPDGRWVAWYKDVGLDANSYGHKDRLSHWLAERSIPGEHRQDGKLFEWYFTTQEDAVAFQLTWSQP